MKRVFVFLIISFSPHMVDAQSIQVKKDTVKIASGELQIDNSTKNIAGYLYNIGNGITQFKPVSKYVDSIWAKQDTIYYIKDGLQYYKTLIGLKDSLNLLNVWKKGSAFGGSGWLQPKNIYDTVALWNLKSYNGAHFLSWGSGVALNVEGNGSTVNPFIVFSAQNTYQGTKTGISEFVYNFSTSPNTEYANFTSRIQNGAGGRAFNLVGVQSMITNIGDSITNMVAFSGHVAQQGEGSIASRASKGIIFKGGFDGGVSGIGKFDEVSVLYADSIKLEILKSGLPFFLQQKGRNMRSMIEGAYFGLPNLPQNTDASSKYLVLSNNGYLEWVNNNNIAEGGTAANFAISFPIGGASTGGVLYSGTGGLLQQSSSNFYYDSVNSRLGIGTNKPAATIHSINTLEPLRVGHDSSNYASFKVSSTGSLLIELSPSSSTFSVSKHSILQGGFRTNTAITNSNFSVPTAATAVSTSTSASLLFGGATSSLFRRVAAGSGNSLIPDNASYGGTIFGGESITEGTSGNHKINANVVIIGQNITNSTATTGIAASLYINGAPTGTASISEKYSFYNASGNSLFGGSVMNPGITNGAINDSIVVVKAGTNGTFGKVAMSSLTNMQNIRSFNDQSINSYVISLEDSYSTIRLNNSSPVTVSIPDDASANFPVGTIIPIYQVGTGTLTITPLNGTVSVNAPGGKFKTADQYSKIWIEKQASNLWYVSGDLKL